MKRFACLLLLLSYLQVYADNYKILQLNTNYIKIGKTTCRQGDVFSDEDQIYWANDHQAMKAMNVKTKEIKVFVSKEFINAKAKGIKDYYIKINHLSTRGEIMTFSDLAEELSNTLYILDSYPIESPIMIDSLSSYVVSYEKEGKQWRNLMSTDDMFFISRDLFEVGEEYQEFTLSLFFRRKNMDDYLITDKLNVVFLPLKINE